MKKSLLFVSLVTLMAGHLGAQITINKSHLTGSGKMIVQAYDYKGYPLTSAGTNYTWDFSNLVEDDRDTIHYGLPQWYPGASQFPNTNLVSMYNSVDSSYEYLTLTDNDLTYQGTYDVSNGVASVDRLNLKMLTFPSTYNSTFTDATSLPGQKNELGLDPDGPGPLPLIDSIYYEVKLNSTSIMDGHGTIKTPLGSYPTLRQKMTIISDIDNIKMYANGAWSTVPKIYLALLGMGNTADTTYRIIFWSNDNTLGQPLVQYEYGNRDTSTGDITWLASKSQASKITSIAKVNNVNIYPNPCQNSFKVQLSNVSSANLIIYNFEGQIVYQSLVNNGDQIDVSKFANGVYLLKLSDLKTGTIIGNQKLTKY